MKNLKRILSAIISLTMVFSLLGAFSAFAADEVEYNFYTQVGTAFVPETEGVTWQSTDSIDTSVMGRQVISGTDNTTGTSVKGIINVGAKKYVSYQNNQAKTADTELAYGSDYMDQWRLVNSKDVGSGLGKYVSDPDNENNIVAKYTAYSTKTDGTKTANQIAYYPTTAIAAGTSFTVELRINLNEALEDDAEQIRIYGSTNTTATAETIIIKKTSANYSVKLNGGSSASIPITGDWLNVKYCEDTANDKAAVYVNGTKLSEISLLTSGGDGLLYIDYKHIPVDNTQISKPTYLDDVKITSEATTDFIYYDNFENVYNYDFLQGAGTETINVCEEVKLVDAKGNDSGYSVPIFAAASADISTLGTYGSTTAIEGFDEPINISWTVYKEALAWQENFQGYEESGIGSAPYLEPFAGSSDTTGKTVEFESETSPNKLLKYTTKTKDNPAIFTNNEYIDGKAKLSYRFMVPKLYKEGGFAIPVMGYGYGTNSNQNAPLIDLNVSFSGGKGSVSFKQYDGYKTLTDNPAQLSPHYIINSTLEQEKWYTLTFILDFNTDTFNYTLNENESVGPFRFIYSGLKFSQLRLSQTDNTLVNDVTLYFDDLKVDKYLTIKEPVNKTINVYKGDEIVYSETVEVLLTDNKTTDTAPVQWNGSIDTTTPGTKTITGKVTGTSAPITLTAVITPYPYEIVAPVLKNGETEVFGLIDGGNLSAVTVKKISNETIPGKLYAALFDVSGEMLGVNLVSMPTADTWVKDEIKDVAITLSLDVESTVNIDECKLKTFIFSDSLEPYSISNIMTNANSSGTPAVWIAGDSTAARYAESRRPETGWAEAFNDDYAALAGITVQNGTINGVGGVSGTGAIGGQSSKSYVDQGRLEKILENAQAGDYLFIQFGHNDSADEEYRHTDPDTTYKEYITTFVTEARKHGVIPVIFTSIARGRYTGANGTFNGDTHANLDKYANAAKEIAALYHVPMVDLHKKTSDVLRQLNAEDAKQYFLCLQDCTGSSDADCINVINGERNHALWCANYPEGMEDRTHLNQYGAQWVAGLAAQGLQEIKLPLANLLKTQ